MSLLLISWGLRDYVCCWMDGCLPAWLLFHCTRAMYVTIFFNRIKYQPLKDAIIIFLFIMKQTTQRRLTRSFVRSLHRLLLLFFFCILITSSQHRAHSWCVCSAVLPRAHSSAAIFSPAANKDKILYYVPCGWRDARIQTVTFQHLVSELHISMGQTFENLILNCPQKISKELTWKNLQGSVIY